MLSERRFFRGQEPVGRQMRMWGSSLTGVGVVKDIKYRNFGETPQPYFYQPMEQTWEPSTGFVLHVRTVGPPLQLLSELRRELRSVDPRVHLFEVGRSAISSAKLGSPRRSGPLYWES
jgi:hypothetical protein